MVFAIQVFRTTDQQAVHQPLPIDIAPLEPLPPDDSWKQARGLNAFMAAFFNAAAKDLHREGRLTDVSSAQMAEAICQRAAWRLIEVGQLGRNCISQEDELAWEGSNFTLRLSDPLPQEFMGPDGQTQKYLEDALTTTDRPCYPIAAKRAFSQRSNPALIAIAQALATRYFPAFTVQVGNEGISVIPRIGPAGNLVTHLQSLIPIVGSELAVRRQVTFDDFVGLNGPERAQAFVNALQRRVVLRMLETARLESTPVDDTLILTDRLAISFPKQGQIGTMTFQDYTRGQLQKAQLEVTYFPPNALTSTDWGMRHPIVFREAIAIKQLLNGMGVAAFQDLSCTLVDDRTSDLIAQMSQ